MLTEIMYRLFLASLGYAKDIDLAELEIGLEAEGRFEEFKKTFQSLHGKDWDDQKGMTIFALNEASAVLHKLNPATYPMADSWSKGRPKMDITAGRLADRIVELMKRRKPGHSLMFVVDEVGQFVARDTQKMLDLQGIVQQLGVKGRGKYWIAVTSQERLSEVVSGLDDRRIELPKLMDRFPLQVHLEPSDISEVTSRRVLKKTSAAETVLGKLYDDNRARLDLNSRITADVTFPSLSRERFIDLYPLLPYQIELIIDIVSGLRMQGGASKHVGGANRTIIKLAQQLLINPATMVSEAPIGTLIRLDQVYDLIEGNIGSDIRAKIISIPNKVDHSLAQYLVLNSDDDAGERDTVGLKKKDPRDLRIIDPACGSGHFLLYCFLLLLVIYEEAWTDEGSPESRATGRTLRADYPSLDELRKAAPALILSHNLHGVDIDPRCAQIAQLALWMRGQGTQRFGHGVRVAVCGVREIQRIRDQRPIGAAAGREAFNPKDVSDVRELRRRPGRRHNLRRRHQIRDSSGVRQQGFRQLDLSEREFRRQLEGLQSACRNEGRRKAEHGHQQEYEISGTHDARLVQPLFGADDRHADRHVGLSVHRKLRAPRQVFLVP
jgi:hypothetical protein